MPLVNSAALLAKQSAALPFGVPDEVTWLDLITIGCCPVCAKLVAYAVRAAAMIEALASFLAKLMTFMDCLLLAENWFAVLTLCFPESFEPSP
ncbi:MAG: hypothetical protein JNK80_10130 [Dechloromonas sp.]|nr:hypothetical protein [Dechloromonas sp.]